MVESLCPQKAPAGAGIRAEDPLGPRFLQVLCRGAPKPQVITMSEPAKKSLDRTGNACHRVGWLSFWTQLSLSVVSAGILLFSVAFTSQVSSTAAFQHGCASSGRFSEG